MAQVLTGTPAACALIAATALESTPPLRNAPTGTSLTRWDRTALSRYAHSASGAPASPSGEGTLALRKRLVDSQYRRGAPTRPSFTVKVCPGGRRLTPSRLLSGS